MELLKLNPDQIDDVFTIKEILSVDDIDSIIYALQVNNWNIDLALQSLICHQKQHTEPQSNSKEWQRELDKFTRHSKVEKTSQARSYADRAEIARQNEEYQKMANQHSAKEKNQRDIHQLCQRVERQAAVDREYFRTYSPTRPIHIKFRLTLKSATATFDLQDSVLTLYRYINAHLRDAFQSKHSRFDLLLCEGSSLAEFTENKLSGMFGEELAGVVLIVKELE